MADTKIKTVNELEKRITSCSKCLENKFSGTAARRLAGVIEKMQRIHNGF